MRTIVAKIITCFFCIACVAQEQDAPKNLVGFLKPGMHIGVVSFPDSDRILVEIYTEQDHAIAIDARKLSIEELASKYDRVATALERKRAEILATQQAQKQELPAGKTYGEAKIGLYSVPRAAFYRIASTGDDYILVTSATAPAKRRVLATRFIHSINWRDELDLTWSVEYIEKTAEEPKK